MGKILFQALCYLLGLQHNFLGSDTQHLFCQALKMFSFLPGKGM